jgi:hypothetical protein
MLRASPRRIETGESSTRFFDVRQRTMMMLQANFHVFVGCTFAHVRQSNTPAPV